MSDETPKKVIKITYKRKKRKNPRTFDMSDSTFMNRIMVTSADVVFKIDKAIQDGTTLPEMLPISTEFLYDLSVGFMAMYEKLERENLIKTGSNVYNETIH